jgi:ribose transport system substrate-binding protein
MRLIQRREVFKEWAGLATLGTILPFIDLAAGPAAAEDVVALARAEVAKFTGPQTAWLGPTSAPKPQSGKNIVFLCSDERLEIDHLYGVYMAQAAAALGWKVIQIDGKGTPSGWLSGMNQAVALRPDGIATSADVRGLQQPIRAGIGLGIKFIGMHAASGPGPQPDLHLFTNIQGDTKQIGRAQALWIIANSGGSAQVVIMTHNEYAIARVKSTAVRDTLATCKGCAVDVYSNTPAGESPERIPQLMTSWLQRFQRPFYMTTVGDSDFDYAVPVLRNARIPFDSVRLVGADGYKAAYERIRKGEYQVVTVPEPIEEQSYQAVDEFNRAFNSQPFSGFVQPPYLVTKDNVNNEGGDKDVFTPSNDYKGHYRAIWGVGS